MPNYPTTKSGWKLVCYHKSGAKEVHGGSNQQAIYERMCSKSFRDDLIQRGFTAWEMVQEVNRVIL